MKTTVLRVPVGGRVVLHFAEKSRGSTKTRKEVLTIKHEGVFVSMKEKPKVKKVGGVKTTTESASYIHFSEAE